ncbi:AmiS/UreI family transporter [Flagellimonas sp.]|uniref:AmiS/UreI family transporter n=1 Tax=Flagellimonas sp. TaxID=2058762 RepID=UPI003B5C7E50
MGKSQKVNRGLILIFVGFLFSILGVTLLTKNEQRNLLLIALISGALIVVLGLYKIFKANSANKKNL